MKLLKIKIADEVSNFTVVVELDTVELFRLGDILEDAAVAAETYRKVERNVDLRMKIDKIYAAAVKLYDEIAQGVAAGNLMTEAGEWNATD